MSLRLYSLTVLLCLLCSCSRMASHVAEHATSGAISGGLESATQEGNKRRIQELVRDTAIQADVAKLDPDVVDTVIARLAAVENARHVHTIGEVVARSALIGLARPRSKEDERQRDELVATAVRVAVNSAVDELKRTLPGLIRDLAADPTVQAALQPLSRTAGKGAAEGVVDSVTGGGPPAAP